jgi:hypothetical protein
LPARSILQQVVVLRNENPAQFGRTLQQWTILQCRRAEIIDRTTNATTLAAQASDPEFRLKLPALKRAL